MVKVIETNLSLQVNNEIIDHQSRVIEVESWDMYIKEIKNGESVFRKDILGSLDGTTIPSKFSKVEELAFSSFHMSCTVYQGNVKTKKLAYLVVG